MKTALLTLLFAFCTLMVFNVFPSASLAQEAADAKKETVSDENDEEKKKPKEVAEALLDTSNVSSRRPQFPEKYVRFHMWDGSIIGGEVTADSVTVETDFGPLVVPINRIRKLHPGLGSLPELNSQIDTLVAGLGDRDFDVREKSQKELISMGLQIRAALDDFDSVGSAERKKRLNEVKAAIDETLDEFDEDDQENSEQTLVKGDTVVTPDFSIVGKIKNEEFIIKSKFGELKVKLGDIRVADRAFKEAREEIRKSVSIGGKVFFQKQPVSTKIRVNVGDLIKIQADGSVRWTNWNTSSTPEGLPNHGAYQGIQCGTLCARIGSNGSIQKIGKENEFVAKKSGVLYLAIAMQDTYTKNNGYNWTGEFKAKVRITPTEK